MIWDVNMIGLSSNVHKTIGSTISRFTRNGNDVGCELEAMAQSKWRGCFPMKHGGSFQKFCGCLPEGLQLMYFVWDFCTNLASIYSLVDRWDSDTVCRLRRWHMIRNDILSQEEPEVTLPKPPSNAFPQDFSLPKWWIQMSKWMRQIWLTPGKITAVITVKMHALSQKGQ